MLVLGGGDSRHWLSMMASSRPGMPPCDSSWGDSSERLKVTPLPTLVAVEDAQEDWAGGGGEMQVECVFMCVSACVCTVTS